MINKDKVGKKMVSFEKLDLMLGDRAPFLVSLSDGLDNELRIIISPASIGEVGSRNVEPADSILHGILSKCRPITPDQGDQYEIHFENYIVYQNRNESWATYFPEEIRCGTFLITFEKSRLLDSLCEITDVIQSDNGTWYPGMWKHYGVYTQNHVIDVISHCPPVVTRYII